MKKTKNYPQGSPEYVYYHGLIKSQKGKNPSACLSEKFGGFKNPKIAFIIAKILLNDTDNTLLGKQFLRSEIDYYECYKKHLAGPNKDIPFYPEYGVDKCTCSDCFYRHGPAFYNPKKDCQIVPCNPKTFFGFSQKMYLPPIIAGKDLGHYCSSWLSPFAE
jgi:hypothetical protein